ncbi:MAG: hypothetical protein ACLFVJ_14675 [Persicimonas sp.]
MIGRASARLVFLAAALSLGVLGCSEEIDGPAPGAPAETEEAEAFEPGFMCNEQVDVEAGEGWVTISGSEFSPLVADALEDSRVEYPEVTLTLAATIEGDETEDSFETTLVADDDSEATQIRWIDSETLQFRISDDLELPEGSYDVTITNPNELSATAEAAFGVLPRPSVTGVVPDMACVAQGERQAEVVGDHFLVGGGETPTVQIGEETYDVEQAEDCRALNETAFGDFEVCRSLTVNIPEGDFDPGTEQVVVHNIEPAGCSSNGDDDGVELLVVGPPSVDELSPEPICSAQLDYADMSVTGENFITVTDGDDTSYPTVTVDGTEYTATAADGCEDIDGLTNQTAQRCTELTFEIGADDHQDGVTDGERAADLDVSVANPQPAGCSSTEEVALTVAPPPSVGDAQPEPTCVADQERQVTVSGFGFLELEGELPQVQIGSNTYDADELADCETVSGFTGEFDSCDELTVTIPEADVDADMNHTITVVNPERAACESTEAVDYYVADRPTVDRINPQPICTSNGDNVVFVQGENFLEIEHEDDQGAIQNALPMVNIGGMIYDAVSIGDCEDAPLQDDGMQRPTRVCTTIEVVVGQDDLDAGDHDVTVTNPLEADCTSDVGDQLNVVPPPTLASITEDIACVEQGADSFVIDGQDFLVIDDEQPTVEIDGNSYEATADPDTCDSTTVDGRPVETCTSLSFTVPEGDLAPAVHEVSVVNPDSAACSSTNTLDLTIHPPPSVTAVQPNPICSEAGGTVEVTGTDLLVYGDDTPAITIDGVTHEANVDTANDCSELTSVTSETVYNCTRVTLDVDAADLSEGAHLVEATNPDPVGCSSSDTTELVSIAEPQVDSATEDITCTEGTNTLTLAGSDFAKTENGDLPTVTVGGQAVQTVSASGCSAVGTTAIETCTELEIDASGVTLSEGSQDIVVTNPGGAGCASDGTTGVDVFAAADVTNVDPPLYCDQTGGTDLTVEGDNIFIVDGDEPTVEIDGDTFATTIDSANCTTVNSRIESCSSLTVNIGETDLDPNDYQLTVINAGPLDCTGGDSATIVEAGAPTIDSAQPDAVCDNDTTFSNDGTVALTGQNFLIIDSDQPTVTVNGENATVDAMTNCSQVTNPDYNLESCTDMTITVPSSERDADMDIEVQNASPASCGEPASYTVTIEPSPEVTSVTPLRICRRGGSFQIDGTDFDSNMTVELGGVTADTVDVNADGTSATATFDNPPAPGDYDLTVTNPSACQDTHDQQVTVVAGPQVFYVDPPVAYNGINTQVTIYMSGLEGGSVDDVTITDSQGTSTSLDINFDPTKPNTVQATIPSDILEDGLTEDMFDVEVTDDVNCSGTASDLLTVTDELTVAVDDIDPPFGWKDSSTGVAITSPDPAPSGMTNFVSTPRVYLNPVDAGSTTLATELSSVQFVDDFELNAIVPSGLPVGEYDVIVVNPDGTVGLLTDPNDEPDVGAFEVTQDPPPLIDSVSPGSWSNQETALDVTVEGDNFRQPAVEVFCSDDAGNIESPDSITVVASTDTLIELAVDTSNLDHLTSCYMVVTNTDNGTYAEYSPITVTNPAGNFVGFNPGTDMNVPRRDPAMSSGVPSRRARFLYAIGGDDGANANPLRSMEASQLDRFGQPRSWQVLPPPYDLTVPQNELPDDLTHAEATRIDDFIYLVGGFDGTDGVTDTVLRANVLDPLDVPEISNVELTFTEGTPGNDPGTYYYRISAVLDTNAEHNPGGETLPSEPQPVSIPLQLLQVELTWPSFPDAVEYRVYRTDQPNQSVGTEELLAVVPAPSDGDPVTYTDSGFDSVDSGATPLPLGSVGVWHQPDDTNGDPVALKQARYHHGVTSAPNPDDDDEHFVYATTGGDGNTVFDDYEYFSVTVNGPRDQSVSAVTQDDSNVLSTPRWRNPAVVATPLNSNLTDSYVYVLGGEDANGSVTRRNDAALVNANGTLDTWEQVAGNQRDRFEYGAAVANNAVVTAGGGNNSTDENADSTEICDLTSTCDPPELQGWNSLSQVDLRSRAQPGYVSFNGFFYMAGGYSHNTGATLETTDYTVMGGNP